MELINQPFTGQLGNRLIELLKSSDYHTLNILVAFAKNSGVLRIKEALEKFRERGGMVNAYVGVDLGGTSYEAMTALLILTDSLNVVHSEKNQTFHSKIYQFIGEGKGLIIVGSHNLTGGGLWTNFESSVVVPVEASSANVAQNLDDYVGELRSLKGSFMPINAQEDIDKLLENGYLLKEVSQQIREARAERKAGTAGRLFGYGAPAKLPSIAGPEKELSEKTSSAPEKSISDPRREDWTTIWFESKKMTGGSRNILDLSMKSLVTSGDVKDTPFDLGDPRLMRGGVEFFGLNPEDIDKTKNVTLNFEGVDYEGNTILFPEGSNANGTWRLQIKGVSAEEEKITSAFRKKGSENYLVNKIITFTRIRDDYYFMSVFDESELQEFRSASRIVARNGATNNAKRLGLI